MNVRSRKIVRDLMGNRARTLLVVLAIAIGLTGLSTTLRARAIFTENLTEELAAVNPSSATVVTSGSTAAQVTEVASLDTVAEAEGTLVTFGRIAVGDDRRPLRLLIVDDLGARSMDRLRPDAGRWPPPTGTIALERSSIDAAQLDIGDAASITDPLGESHELPVAATAYDLTVVSGRLVEQVVFGYASTATWDQLGLPTEFNEVVFTTATGRSDEAHIAEVAQEVAAVLEADPGANESVVQSIRIPVPDKHVLDNVVASLLLILGSLGILSLVLSGFLVFNTVAALLARQTPQIGVMKAIGASRRDVLTIYLTTVGAYSLLALAIALPAGAFLAAVLSRQLGALLNIDITTFGAPLWVWLVEIACGVLVPAVAALGPILAGTRTTVAEAIRGGDANDGFGTGATDRLLARIQRLPATVGYAARNTFRRKLRLALTVIALALGGAILVTVLSLRSSLFATVDSVAAYWQQDVTVDLQETLPFDDVRSVAEAANGVGDVEGWLIAPASVVRPDGRVAGDDTLVFGVPPGSPFIEPTLVEGRWLEDRDGDAIVLNVDVAANEADIGVGDDITMKIRGVDTVWQVVGISTTQLVAPGAPRPSAPIAYVPGEQLGAAIGAVGAVNRVVISGHSPGVGGLGGGTLDAPAQQDLADAIDAELSASGIGVQSIDTRSRLRAQVERLTTPILLLLASMAVLFALVGGLGLLGTMSLNVLERTKEIGMIRAVGATGRTVLSIVLIEGLTVAALSWLLGSIMAVPMSWIMGRAVGVSFIKVPLDFRFDPLGVGLWFAMALVLALVAGWLPARNASRLSIRDAIAYE